MTSILALDPAWTDHEPSGVALLESTKKGWRCVALSPSYNQFLKLANGVAVDWSQAPSSGEPDVDALMSAARALLGDQPIDLVTIDMPISLEPILQRRVADAMVSQEFGSRGCSTHSPSPTRPGPLGQRLTDRFQELGYPVATSNTPVGTPHVICEVYPHPALLHLMKKDFRYRYKIGRASEYWKDKTPEERKRRIVKNWHKIVDELSKTINKIELPLPAKTAIDSTSASHLKRYEDALDALLSAWVGVQYLAGDCTGFGDHTAAIWVPPKLDR
jgi:predicted RNase H-like nuclease